MRQEQARNKNEKRRRSANRKLMRLYLQSLFDCGHCMQGPWPFKSHETTTLTNPTPHKTAASKCHCRLTET